MKANIMKTLSAIIALSFGLTLTSPVKAEPTFDGSSAGIIVFDVKLGKAKASSGNNQFLATNTRFDNAFTNNENSKPLKNVFENNNSTQYTSKLEYTDLNSIDNFLSDKPNFITYDNSSKGLILIAEKTNKETDYLVEKERISTMANNPRKIDLGLN